MFVLILSLTPVNQSKTEYNIMRSLIGVSDDYRYAVPGRSMLSFPPFAAHVLIFGVFRSFFAR